MYIVHGVCHIGGPGSTFLEQMMAARSSQMPVTWATSKAGLLPAGWPFRVQSGTSALTDFPQESSISFLYEGEQQHVLESFFFSF